MTFKAMADRPGDTLLHKVGSRWEIVGDKDLVDLQDRTQTYKLGQVEISS